MDCNNHRDKVINNWRSVAVLCSVLREAGQLVDNASGWGLKRALSAGNRELHVERHAAYSRGVRTDGIPALHYDHC